MNELILQVENPSLLKQLKEVLSLIKGVKIINTKSSAKSVDMEDVSNVTTLAAMKEAESGNDAGVVRVDNLANFMASIEE